MKRLFAAIAGTRHGRHCRRPGLAPGSLLLAALTAGVLLASATAAAQQKYRFALVPKAANDPYMMVGRDGCLQAQVELPQVECIYTGPAENIASEQVQIVRDLIAKGIDGIAVSVADAVEMVDAFKAARDAGIPVVTWDADLYPEDREYRAVYVGTNNYEIGVNLAKIVKSLKPDGGRICLQSGGAAAANHNERLKGIRDTLGLRKAGSSSSGPLNGENGWTEIAGSPLVTDDDNATAVQQLLDALNLNPDLDAFITTGEMTQRDDDVFRQAMEPSRRRLASGKLVFVSADTLLVQIQQLKDRLSNGQVGQRPFEMGRLSMYRLLDLKKGRPVVDPEYTGIDVCTKDNVAPCLKRQSLRR